MRRTDKGDTLLLSELIAQVFAFLTGMLMINCAQACPAPVGMGSQTGVIDAPKMGHLFRDYVFHSEDAQGDPVVDSRGLESKYVRP